MQNFFSIEVEKYLNYYQFNVTNAFLNSKIDNEMYGIFHTRDGKKIVNIKRAIYVLKKSTIEWGKMLRTTLKSKQLIGSNIDWALYYHKDKSKMIFLIVSVDDFMLFTSKESDFRNELHRHFKNSWKIGCIGKVKKIVVINIHQNDDKP